MPAAAAGDPGACSLQLMLMPLSTIATLTGLLMKWDGLSLVQRRMPNSKELIVRTTEDAILLQHNSFVAGAANMSGPGGDDDEDQHEDGDEENATKKKTK